MITTTMRSALLLAAMLPSSVAGEQPPLTIGQLLAQGWEIAGCASGYENRTSLILFRKLGVNALIQCSALYDVTRSPRTIINCYELRLACGAHFSPRWRRNPPVGFIRPCEPTLTGRMNVGASDTRSFSEDLALEIAPLSRRNLALSMSSLASPRTPEGVRHFAQHASRARVAPAQCMRGCPEEGGPNAENSTLINGFYEMVATARRVIYETA